MPDLSHEARLALSRRTGAGWHLAAHCAGCRVIAGIEIDRLVARVPGSTPMAAPSPLPPPTGPGPAGMSACSVSACHGLKEVIRAVVKIQ